MPRDFAFRPLNAGLEELYSLGLKYRQELKAAVRAIAAANEAQRLAELARVPDFAIGVTYSQIGQAVAPVPDSGDDAVGSSRARLLCWRSSQWSWAR